MSEADSKPRGNRPKSHRCVDQGMDLDAAMRAAVASHQSGDLRQAETLYRQVLNRHPRHVDAQHLLGVLAHQTGRQASP